MLLEFVSCHQHIMEWCINLPKQTRKPHKQICKKKTLPQNVTPVKEHCNFTNGQQDTPDTITESLPICKILTNRLDHTVSFESGTLQCT